MSAHITATPGICGGKPCIAGHRIRVSDIAIWHEQQGLTADAIASQYPGITLADVYAALSYYYEHLDAIREEIRVELADIDAFRQAEQSALRAKLNRAKLVS